MALPADFNEWTNLRDLVKLEHNKAVKSYFKNQPDDDVSTSKSRLKHSCVIKDNDTVDMLILRMWLFEVTCGHTQAIQRPVYGIPVQEAQSEWKFKPQIKLHFLEAWDKETHEIAGLPQLEGEIGFRLMDESSESITRAKAEILAKKIKQEFASPVFIWEKGWYKATYLDSEKGYDFRLFVKSKVEGERIVKQVLNIQNHTFNKDFFQFVEHDRTYPTNPGTHKVYGKTIKKPIKRRRADVKF
ncbi:hypothetical protein, partial [Iningainema tapete]